jgi:hypothetical protein
MKDEDGNVINIYLREIGCGDGRQMELAQDHVQWQTLVLTESCSMPNYYSPQPELLRFQ